MVISTRKNKRYDEELEEIHEKIIEKKQKLNEDIEIFKNQEDEENEKVQECDIKNSKKLQVKYINYCIDTLLNNTDINDIKIDIIKCFLDNVASNLKCKNSELYELNKENKTVFKKMFIKTLQKSSDLIKYCVCSHLCDCISYKIIEKKIDL